MMIVRCAKNFYAGIFFEKKISKKKVLPGFEPGSLDSKSRVITATL